MQASETLFISFSTSSLGLVLIARTHVGVRAVLIGDDEGMLREDIRRRFPAATISLDDDDAFSRRVIDILDGVESNIDELPLDMRGTPFQRMVWNALRDIPAGRTATYSDVAARVGSPAAVRAVAGACASNALAVIVPCHRVVRQDGSLSGYRWGVDRKRALLERESRAGK